MSLFCDASHRLPSPQRSKILTILSSPGQSCGSLSQCSVSLCLAHAVWPQQQCAWSLQRFVWLADHATVYHYSWHLGDPAVLSVSLSVEQFVCFIISLSVAYFGFHYGALCFLLCAPSPFFFLCSVFFKVVKS